MSLLLGKQVSSRTKLLGTKTHKKNETIKVPQNRLRSGPTPVSFLESTPQRALSTFSNRAIYKPSLLGNTSATTANYLLESSSSASILKRNYTNDKPTVFLSKDVDVSKLRFTPAKVAKATGPRIIHTTYDSDNKLLRIQTPVMRAPFGVTKFAGMAGQPTPANAAPNFSLQLSFDGMDTNPEIKKFYDLINSIDATVCAAAAKSGGKEWFDKEIAAVVLDHNFKKSIKAAKNESYAPVMKLKIPVDFDATKREAIPRTHVWVDREPVSIDEIKPGSKLINIIELKYIWAISTSMWGITWNLLQTKIVEKPVERLNNYSFIEPAKTPGAPPKM